ncbi:MAG: UDP-N-acetylmuramate--L-alanine ligase [Spirochaetaceae bacterium]|jgi:UDP-N-acetylmuramate--alanine ligase|nr:UDP-N-acetylmuramate--L-alanine ligase [Spirochaetaceae bacterium]
MFAKKVYGVGIKGTGMCALAELLHGQGVSVSGSDTGERFYTNDILSQLHIPFYESFDAAHVPLDADIIIHSAAYNTETNPELAYAKRMGLKIMKYTDALGEYSKLFYSCGICGVNGKTTTAIMTGALLRGLSMPAQVLAGSASENFARADGGARSCINLGNNYFVAETCEYRGHFLSFQPRIIVLTNIEHDHQDFFPTYESIRDMFIQYIHKLPPDGILIYCADDKGAVEAVSMIQNKSITTVPYGFKANGDYKIDSCVTAAGKTEWTLAGFGKKPLTLYIPGRHNVLNAAAAAALSSELFRHYKKERALPESAVDAICRAFAGFRGGKRRCEIVGQAGGVLFIDDYGHHPTAIKTTLEGLKEFYSGHRIIVSFMPHTYTRTAALLSEFAACFDAADILYLHKIYPSAREQYNGTISGKTLFEETKKHHSCVYYIDEHENAASEILPVLKDGDVFVTVGAGDNWKLGRALYSAKQRHI